LGPGSGGREKTRHWRVSDTPPPRYAVGVISLRFFRQAVLGNSIPFIVRVAIAENCGCFNATER